MILFIDAETTGLPDYRLPVDAPSQPSVLQLSVLTETEVAINSYVVPMQPVPADVVAIHGITTEIATLAGRPRVEVALYLLGWLHLATEVVAFNAEFDWFLIQTMFARSGIARESWPPRFCCMKASRDICCIPPTDRQVAAGYGNEWKTPSLAEAYRIICGKEIRCAHDALADAEACRELYYALKGMGR